MRAIELKNVSKIYKTVLKLLPVYLLQLNKVNLLQLWDNQAVAKVVAANSRTA